MSDEHYLQAELYALVQKDPRVFEFLQAGSLDGIWYWDLERPDIEWMSARFWTTLGWDPAQRKHESAEWKDLIHPDDLKIALDEYFACLATPGRLYDCPEVRYKRPDGTWSWVRCRGYMVRDEDGKPVRLLGAHNELTRIKVAEEGLAARLIETEALNEELAAFNRIAVGREERMIELKAEVNALLARLGEGPRYDLSAMVDDEDGR